MAKLDRVKTHITGFDELLEGGFVKGSTNLLVGKPGTGKTIFSLQFLYNGAVKDREKGVYFTFEEKKDSLIEQARQFGWDLEALEKKGKIRIISIGYEDITQTTADEVLEIILNTGAKRVVLDSITTLAHLSPQSETKASDEFSIRRFIYLFLTRFRKVPEVTSLMISQKDNSSLNIVSEYICDGVIDIEQESLGGDFSRNMIIKKMRKTKNDEDLHPVEISNEGLIVHNLD